MSKAYKITQWELYERSETRKTDFMSWYPKQTKLTGIGIGATLRHADGLKLLGTWNLIEILASLAPVGARGWLARDGVPLTAEDMASLIPAVKPEDFQAALTWFSSAKIKWLELADYAPAAAHREPDGNSPGKVPSPNPPAAAHREPAGENSATDRQIDRQETDRHPREKDKKGASLEASKLQWSAVTKRIKELEGKASSQTPEDKAELRQKRALLRQIEAQQAAGTFETVQTSGGTP